MRILIIEDEEKLAKSLKQGLEREGYAVDFLTDGETGLKRINIHHSDYDLVILDLMLPNKTGFEIIKEVRSNGIKTPILILTARDTVNDKISLLDSGADDYLTKPFSLEELLARARALLRRPEEVLQPELTAGQFVLNVSARKVFKNGKPITLTLKEFSLLEYLMRNPNQVLTREDMLSHVWDFEFDSFSNVVDVHIKNLRKKLKNGRTNEEVLETVRGVGYKLKIYN